MYCIFSPTLRPIVVTAGLLLRTVKVFGWSLLQKQYYGRPRNRPASSGHVSSGHRKNNRSPPNHKRSALSNANEYVCENLGQGKNQITPENCIIVCDFLAPMATHKGGGLWVADKGIHMSKTFNAKNKTTSTHTNTSWLKSILWYAHTPRLTLW